MSDQIADRKAKLEKIRALGVDPYGGRFTGVTPNADIRAAAEKLGIEAGQLLEGEQAVFRAAGRVVLHRDIGSLIFMTVRDQSGDLQFGLSKKMVKQAEADVPMSRAWSESKTRSDEGPPTSWKLAKLLDLGDIVGADGRLGRTKTGELTLWVTRLTMLSKALRPPPEKRLGLTDIEARYRRRHVDLFSNPGSRAVFLQRARIIDYARRILGERGFVEVETPVLQPIYGGAAARPFLTHHNTLDMDLYLRISPELYLKRCLVGGLERVYEIGRCFRNEGLSPRHNPEFTMLELYQAYADYHDMMEITEAIIAGAAREAIGSTRIKFGEVEIDYSTPWPRLRYADLLKERTPIDLDSDDELVTAKNVIDCARQLGILEKMSKDPKTALLRDPITLQEIEGGYRAADAVIVQAIFDEVVEPTLIQPTFVLGWPAALCPLTRIDAEDPRYALRFELFINGMEIGNAYSELNDPAVQRKNLEDQVVGEGNETMRIMDEDFVEALECAMPPAGGLGIGIGRLVMLLTGSLSIRDVILFPLQRPRQKMSNEATERRSPGG